MTHAAAEHGLTYEGTDLQTDPIGLFFELTPESLYGLAEVRGSDVRVPASPGQHARARVKDQRRLRTQPGYVMGTGVDDVAQRADFETRLFALQALLDPTTAGTIEVTLPSGATATIEARPENLLIDRIVPSAAKVQIEWLSVDPEWVVTPAGS